MRAPPLPLESSTEGGGTCGACTPPAEGEKKEENVWNRGDATKALEKHMQRKLVGYAREQLYLIQDFVTTFCYENEKGVMTETKKESMVRMNKVMTRWVRVLARITNGATLMRIDETGTGNRLEADEKKGEITIYGSRQGLEILAY